MSRDLLLAWLSEKGRGTWTELKEAHDWLERRNGVAEPRAWITARDLSALGHLEISWEDGGSWAVAPTVLTLLPGAGRALLTGARTRALYTPPDERAPEEEWGEGKLVDAVNELDLWLDPWTQHDGPTTVTIAVNYSWQAEQLAARLGIPYTFRVGEQLGRMLPPLAAFQRTWRRGELLRGLDAERFDPSTCLWDPIDTEPTDYGLYRCRTYNRMIFALHSPTGWVRVPPEPAVYEVLRWDGTQVLEYDDVRQELMVPSTASLPLLAARSATLCSGRVPRRTPQSGGWARVTYVNVPPPVAERIASSLNQELIHV
jgi:hypothetical protein